jgi:hypothetical protein
MELITKKELLKEFEVEASFYNVRTNDLVFECRSQARIKRKGTLKDEYDAVLVLCNPGSCKSSLSPQELDPRKDKIPFGLAQSDQTQEQVMRLMELRRWDQVNMVNISDICSGNIDDFRFKLKNAKNALFTYHSIFSKERRNELLQVIELNKGPVIAGWGVKPFMKKEITQILLSDLFKEIKGWNHSTYPYYYHPNLRLSEKNKEWLITINEILNEAYSTQP